jgi:hypothetical protein
MLRVPREVVSPILPSERTAAPILLSANSFGASVTAFGLTMFLLHRCDNRRGLHFSRLQCLLKYSYCDSLTVSRLDTKYLQSL